MRRTLFLLLIFAVAFVVTPIPHEPATVQDQVIEEVKIKQDSTIKKTVSELIAEAAIRHGINHERFLATARCESGLRPGAIGDGGHSFGLFQIHLPSHPSVTRDQALDPEWAVEWAAQKFKIDPSIWTCYRNLYQ